MGTKKATKADIYNFNILAFIIAQGKVPYHS